MGYGWTTRDSAASPNPSVIANVTCPISSLACGATIVAAKPGGEQDTDYLVHLAIEKAVTYVDLAPSLLQALLEHPQIQQWTSLRDR